MLKYCPKLIAFLICLAVNRHFSILSGLTVSLVSTVQIMYAPIVYQNIQQLIEYFGDNPTIFVQTNAYICAVIGQCMFLRDLVRFSLPYSGNKIIRK